MAMDIFAGSHIKVYVAENTTAVATNFQEVPEVASFAVGSVESTVIDVVTYNQKYNRKLLGTQAIPNIELMVNLLADNAIHEKLKQHAEDQTRVQIKIEVYEDGTFTTGFFDVYRAFISTRTIAGSKDEVVTATFTLAVDGAPLDSGILS